MIGREHSEEDLLKMLLIFLDVVYFKLRFSPEIFLCYWSIHHCMFHHLCIDTKVPTLTKANTQMKFEPSKWFSDFWWWFLFPPTNNRKLAFSLILQPMVMANIFICNVLPLFVRTRKRTQQHHVTSSSSIINLMPSHSCKKQTLRCLFGVQ